MATQYSKMPHVLYPVTYQPIQHSLDVHNIYIATGAMTQCPEKQLMINSLHHYSRPKSVETNGEMSNILIEHYLSTSYLHSIALSRGHSVGGKKFARLLNFLLD